MEELATTVGIADGTGPDAVVVHLRLSDAPGDRHVEAWLGNFGSSNVHIVAGSLSLAQCQDLLARDFMDVLMTVPSAGIARRRLPSNVGQLTVFFEGANTSGQYEAVTLRVLRA